MSRRAAVKAKPTDNQPLVTVLRMVKDHPLKRMRPWARNPRHNDEAVIAVERSLGRFGAVAPIILDEKGRICAGHTRYKAAVKAGLKTFPAMVCRFADEGAFAGYNITDNQMASIAEWDVPGLDAIIKELGAFDLNIEDLGFTEEGFRELLDSLEDPGPKDGLTDPDDVPQDSDIEARCNPGDLWELGAHRLLCGDATKAEDVGRLMGEDTPTLMVTDPPYGVDYDGGQVNTKKREALIGDDDTAIFGNALRVVAGIMPIGAWYIWHAGRHAEPVYVAIRENGYEIRALLIWNKLNAHYGAPSAHYCQKHEPCLYAVRGSANFIGPSNDTTAWDIEQPHRNEYHPTQKPVECMAHAIRNHEAGIIYDPFVGSGTTIIAAQQFGRRCFAMEIDPHYCDVAITRWEKFTGEKAKLIPVKARKAK